FPDGLIQVTLHVRDAASNADDVDAGSFLLDRTADSGTPLALTIDPTAKGVLAAADLAHVSYTVAGLDDDAGGTITFSDGVNSVTRAVALNGSGTVDLSGFEGLVTASLAVVDAAGNSASASASVVADTVAPNAPTISLVSDTGTYETGTGSDRLTGNDALTVTAGSGDTVLYSIDGVTFLPGYHGFAEDGAHSVWARLVDRAGNVGAISERFDFVLDRSGPNVTFNAPIAYGNGPFVTVSGTADPSEVGRTVQIRKI